MRAHEWGLGGNTGISQKKFLLKWRDWSLNIRENGM